MSDYQYDGGTGPVQPSAPADAEGVRDAEADAGVHDAQASEGARDDLRKATGTAVALAVIGAIMGFVWAAWSPPGPRAQVLGGGEFIVDETESFIAGDGRYLIIVVLVGLGAALLAWFDRAHRGPIVLAGLVVGGIAGSLLMELVGHLTGGGTFEGTPLPGTDFALTARLPLSLHTQGLLLVESAVAALVYGLLVAFAAADDLSRPDPVRDSLVPVAEPSVGAAAQAQDGGRDGDAAGALQQRDLPPQQPGHPD